MCHTGFSTVVGPLYLNEISPINLRGGVGTLNQLGVTLGILISQVLGLESVLGNAKYYQLLFGEFTKFLLLVRILTSVVFTLKPDCRVL